ncbi:MAG TPA: prolyl oligopeptidase family serine peptidase [Blastocatellia bacterium]|nr:prolyl oligopeptidase family serine peptidase [Blastocatellia bacterium]
MVSVRGRPFPAVLFSHGSGHATGVDASGRPDQRHPELLAPVFVLHGYAFLYLFRRGDGLSRGQGTPAGDLMDREFTQNGQEGRNKIQLHLMESDEIDDVLAGLSFLRSLPEIDRNRIALVGHSFGASLTILAAERDKNVKAAVVFSAGGYSWDRSSLLRIRLLSAVGNISVPIFLIHAANDYSVIPGKVLAAELERVKKPQRLKIYPATGQTTDDGHDFIHREMAIWEPDVFKFLDEYTR